MKSKKIDLKEILNKVNIIDVIEEFNGKIKKQGKNYSILCKVHQDTNPSVIISTQKQIFKCFSCGVGGNVLDYLIKFEKMTFKEALLFLNKKFTLDLNLSEWKNQKKFSKYEENMINVIKDATIFFNYSLIQEQNINQEISDFLKKRKINKKLIDDFKLGFSKKDYSKFLIKKNYEKATLISASLLNENEKETIPNRFFIPIKNDDGIIVGYSSRMINAKSSLSIKYLNSKENSLFKKSEIIFNYDKAKENKELILCEGFMDVFALYKVGYKNVVAIMGTSFTKEHLKKLSKHKIILFLDGDIAGQKAQQKILLLLLKNNIETHIIKNNLNLDPDEILNHKGESFLKELIENNVSSWTYLFEYLLSKYNIKNENEFEKFVQEFKSFFLNAPKFWLETFYNQISNKINLSNQQVKNILSDKPEKSDLKYKSINNDYNITKIYEQTCMYSERLIVALFHQQKMFSYVNKKIKVYGEQNQEAINYLITKNNTPNYTISNEEEIKNYIMQISKKTKIFPRNEKELKENNENILKFDKNNIINNTYKKFLKSKQKNEEIVGILNKTIKNKKEILKDNEKKK